MPPRLFDPGRQFFLKSRNPLTRDPKSRGSIQGPGRIRAENGVAVAGTAHAYCGGHSESVDVLRQSEVKLGMKSPRVTGPSSGSA
jgi:hypothetical protein